MGCMPALTGMPASCIDSAQRPVVSVGASLFPTGVRHLVRLSSRCWLAGGQGAGRPVRDSLGVLRQLEPKSVCRVWHHRKRAAQQSACARQAGRLEASVLGEARKDALEVEYALENDLKSFGKGFTVLEKARPSPGAVHAR